MSKKNRRRRKRRNRPSIKEILNGENKEKMTTLFNIPTGEMYGVDEIANFWAEVEDLSKEDKMNMKALPIPAEMRILFDRLIALQPVILQSTVPKYNDKYWVHAETIRSYYAQRIAAILEAINNVPGQMTYEHSWIEFATKVFKYSLEKENELLFTPSFILLYFTGFLPHWVNKGLDMYKHHMYTDYKVNGALIAIPDLKLLLASKDDISLQMHKDMDKKFEEVEPIGIEVAEETAPIVHRIVVKKDIDLKDLYLDSKIMAPITTQPNDTMDVIEALAMIHCTGFADPHPRTGGLTHPHMYNPDMNTIISNPDKEEWASHPHNNPDMTSKEVHNALTKHTREEWATMDKGLNLVVPDTVETLKAPTVEKTIRPQPKVRTRCKMQNLDPMRIEGKQVYWTDGGQRGSDFMDVDQILKEEENRAIERERYNHEESLRIHEVMEAEKRKAQLELEDAHFNEEVKAIAEIRRFIKEKEYTFISGLEIKGQRMSISIDLDKERELERETGNKEVAKA